VDGILVEKATGIVESALTCDLIYQLRVFLDSHPLGFLAGPAGPLQLRPRLVRMPAISFISWDRLPARVRPTKPLPDLAPDLAVEVLSKGNTRKELDRKVRDYFASGTRLVWLVDPWQRSVQVYTALDQLAVLTEGQVLDGGAVLPGLTLPVREIFARMPPQTTGRPSARKRPGPGAKRPKKGKPR